MRDRVSFASCITTTDMAATMRRYFCGWKRVKVSKLAYCWITVECGHRTKYVLYCLLSIVDHDHICCGAVCIDQLCGSNTGHEPSTRQ